MIYPQWIIDAVKKNKKALRDITAEKTKNDIKRFNIHTICDEALCPNKGECFKKNEATFLILGDICTRQCGFCAVKKGKPLPPDRTEPHKIAKLVKLWKLKYVVLTSPTRDDLPDGGATHYYETIKAIKELNPSVMVEPLIPDFNANIKNLEIVISAKPEVIAHNIEMVKRLYIKVRKNQNYERSINVLKNIKKIKSDITVKSGIMIGLGETEDEIKETINDIYKTNCDIIYIGQYISPDKKHFPVQKYYTPEEFKKLEDFSIKLGFKAVLSGPLVRSSYKAQEIYNKVKEHY